jgi:T5orf172 domain
MITVKRRVQYTMIYAFGVVGTDIVKIGCTGKTLQQRFKQIQSGFPFPLPVIGSVEVADNCHATERMIHSLLSEVRRGGEWFAIEMDQERFEQVVAKARAAILAEQERRATHEMQLRLEGGGLGRPRIYATAQDRELAKKRRYRARKRHGKTAHSSQ